LLPAHTPSICGNSWWVGLTYSWRRAVIGSTRDARRAGSRDCAATCARRSADPCRRIPGGHSAGLHTLCRMSRGSGLRKPEDAAGRGRRPATPWVRRPHPSNYRFPPAAAEDTLRLRKHSRQYTGLPCVGLKGTVVSRPHCEQVVIVSVLVKPEPDEPCRLVLQFLQRLGSFLKFLSWKKCCSPAVKTKSAPQSTHLRTRSWNSAIATVPRYQPELLSDMDGGACPTSRHGQAPPPRFTLSPGDSSSGFVCGPAPAWPGASRPASNRRSAA